MQQKRFTKLAPAGSYPTVLRPLSSVPCPFPAFSAFPAFLAFLAFLATAMGHRFTQMHTDSSRITTNDQGPGTSFQLSAFSGQLLPCALRLAPCALCLLLTAYCLPMPYAPCPMPWTTDNGRAVRPYCFLATMYLARARRGSALWSKPAMASKASAINAWASFPACSRPTAAG